MNKWNTIMDMILEEAKDIHKIYYNEEKWCILTSRGGTRYKITENMTIDKVRELIENIKSGRSFSVRENSYIIIP